MGSCAGVNIDVIHYPLKVLGPGIRVGIWLQGCENSCEGCISTHTHNPEKGLELTNDLILKELNSYPTKSVTISGGEPFFQKESLKELLTLLREYKYNDILIYTGYHYKKIMKDAPFVNELCDVLITEPFINGLESDLIWKGSDNQEMYILSNCEGINKKYQLYSLKKKDNIIQRVYKNNRYYLFGIPYQSKWKEIENELSKNLSSLRN